MIHFQYVIPEVQKMNRELEQDFIKRFMTVGGQQPKYNILEKQFKPVLSKLQFAPKMYPPNFNLS